MVTKKATTRVLAVILGDQLEADPPALRGLDPAQDAIWMAEVGDESLHPPSGKMRTALFLSAMRHFRDRMTDRGWTVHYRMIGECPESSLAEALRVDLTRLKPRRLRLTMPGEFRLQRELTAVAEAQGVSLELVEEEHFLVSTQAFAERADGKKQLRMEGFYRLQRRRHDLLMVAGEPAGGRWNFDQENRKGFGKAGPGEIPHPMAFSRDATTERALADVNRLLPDLPGSLDGFDWPVTRAQALRALDDFIEHRLVAFGRYQDAMWRGEPYLYHARLSAALNLKLLNPREVIQAAEQAYQAEAAPLAAVEGFIRQVLGWREYVRGIYWHYMPDYAELNILDARLPLPPLYWSGETDLACLAASIGQTLRLGYAHHIQRLMVTGLFALLLGVDPRRVHEWYLGVYCDAVEWVELPNTLGMSQYADNGLMASKPYVASGKYIQRMSNYCHGCRYDPAKAVGEEACPFTTLYWDFLDRHRTRFARHPRTALQWRNLERFSDPELTAISKQADGLRARFTS